MATVNSATILKAERTLFFRINQAGVPVQLPFDIVTIDKDFQAYEPVTCRYNDKGQTMPGTATGATYTRNNRALPVGDDPCWSYYGI
jgi:hypothetical protein